jgi:hypothetical protein
MVRPSQAGEWMKACPGSLKKEAFDSFAEFDGLFKGGACRNFHNCGRHFLFDFICSALFLAIAKWASHLCKVKWCKLF